MPKLEKLHTPGVLEFCASRNLTNGQLDGYSMEQGDIQSCTTSRWLTDGSDHNRKKNSSMWSDDVLSVLFYFLAAVPTLKVSLLCLRIIKLFLLSLKHFCWPLEVGFTTWLLQQIEQIMVISENI